MSPDPRWSQTFHYDGYGNRYVGADTLPLHGNQPTAFNTNTNAASGAQWNYDKAGYMLKDGVGTDHEYDGEGRLRRYGPSSTGVFYTYDGEGRRVMKFNSGTGQRTIYVYDAEGELAAEYRTDTADPACATAGAPGCTQFLVADHLGSTRVVTALNGTVLGRYDYLPFGGEVPGYLRTESGYGADLKMGVKYTGQVRDTESGLDYFGARYYSATQGRFLSVDPENAGAAMEMPQSWNGYAYVMNNPLLYTDPTGMCGEVDAEGRSIENPWCPIWDMQRSREILDSLWNRTGEKVLEFISRQRDPGCMAGATGTLSAAGTRVGMLFGATAGGVGVPMGGGIGFLAGGTVGYFAGLANCVTGSGPGGGGAGASPPTGSGPLKGQSATEAAFKSHGQPVFSDGRRYITPDVDQHMGGAWKMFDHKGNRLGTFNIDLTKRIGK